MLVTTVASLARLSAAAVTNTMKVTVLCHVLTAGWRDCSRKGTGGRRWQEGKVECVYVCVGGGGREGGVEGGMGSTFQSKDWFTSSACPG